MYIWYVACPCWCNHLPSEIKCFNETPSCNQVFPVKTLWKFVKFLRLVFIFRKHIFFLANVDTGWNCSKIGKHVNINGRECINMASLNFLGMSGRKDVEVFFWKLDMLGCLSFNVFFYLLLLEILPFLISYMNCSYITNPHLFILVICSYCMHPVHQSRLSGWSLAR